MFTVFQLAVVELWRPILRSHLFAPNYRVRINAIKCFFSAFPLENPNDTPTQKMNEEVTLNLHSPIYPFKTYHTRYDLPQATQIQYMVDLMGDCVPVVRVAAINGVCKVLTKYWRILSFAHIDRLLKV